MRLKLFFIAIILLFLTQFLAAQEKERPLNHNAAQAAQFKKEREFAPRESRGGGSLALPFFDDFSRYSLPTNNPEVPQDWQRWTDNAAYVNTTFPISPMTIGVATLDGLKSDGMPYVDTLYFPEIADAYLDWGHADSLTSLPINLDGYTMEDSVFLYFNFECGGRGNQPDADGILGSLGDSLVLEFYSPLQAGEWRRVWAIQGGLDVSSFDTAYIHMNDPIFLQDGFRFRFTNYCTLQGALDHWHLDYVQIEANFNPATYVFDEVAMQYSNNTLLNFGYTSMPWTHFLQDPAFYMADNLTYFERNLGPVDENIPTRWNVTYEGVQQIEGNTDVNGIDNANSEISRTVSLQNYIFDAPSDLDSATFEVCVYFNQTDAHQQNDTACFEQKFTNFYSYDDGTAERAFGIENAGGKVAMKFTNMVADTLLGYYMYFIPVQYLATDQSFIAQVWDDSGGQPGSLLTNDLDNFNFSLPHYFASGPNSFVYYSLLTPIYIEVGDFYVGYVQQNDVSLNMGLDKNTAANTTKLFYQLQGGTNWYPSQIQGSVMIRPVFRSGLPEWVNVAEASILTSELYPNPSHNQISFNMKPDYEKYQCRIMDITGRVMRDEMVVNNGTISLDVTSLEEAPYLLQITSNFDQRTVVKRFVRD